ncbi:MAG: hypothetical protein ACOZNI_19995 [Myxococcota bacterium]
MFPGFASALAQADAQFRDKQIALLRAWAANGDPADGRLPPDIRESLARDPVWAATLGIRRVTVKARLRRVPLSVWDRFWSLFTGPPARFWTFVEEGDASDIEVEVAFEAHTRNE